MIATSSTTTLLLRGASRSRTKDIHGDHQKHYSSLSLSSSSLLSSSSSLPTRNYSWNHKKTFPFSSDATDSTSPSSTETAAPPAQQPSLSIQLYQYAICPFCNRVKALLDYAGLPYQTIEVNPLTKAEIRPFRASTGYTKVPILTIAAPTQNGSEQDADDEEDVQPITDSAKIVQGLLEMEQVQQQLQTLRWNHNNSTWNLDKFQNGPNTQNMVDLAVNDLAAVLYPNMCGSWSDSYRAFEYVQSVPTFTPIQRILIQTIGSVAMYMAASRVKSK
jgi:microsomal prostaglandin-E synthase 2